jgi:hypothetical protein
MLKLDESTLRQLYVDESYSIGAIARLLRVRKQTICDALVQWSIPRRRLGARRDRRPVSADVQQAIKARVAAFGIRPTAQLLGQPPEVIHAILGTRPLPRGEKPRVDRAAARAAYETGTPIAEIAARFGVSTRTIRRNLQYTDISMLDREPDGR